MHWFLVGALTLFRGNFFACMRVLACTYECMFVLVCGHMCGGQGVTLVVVLGHPLLCLVLPAILPQGFPVPASPGLGLPMAPIPASSLHGF